MERGLKIRRIDFYPDDWIAGTQGLNLEEEGLYIRIVMRIYSSGGALPADEKVLAKLCGVRPQLLRRVLKRLIDFSKVREKSEKTGRKLAVNRCETEIKLALNRIETARKAGVSGGRPSQNQRLSETGGLSPSFPVPETPSSPSSPPSKKERKKPTPRGVVKESAATPLAPQPAPHLRRAPHTPKRSARSIADSWQPDEQDRAYAASKGHDTAWVDLQAEMFRDHHLKTGKSFCNWHACWRTWVQNAPQFTRNGGRHAHRPTAANQRFLDGRQATLRAVLKRERAAEAGDC